MRGADSRRQRSSDVSEGTGTADHGTGQVMDALRSGIWTRKSFLHSLGFVMCAGTNGYCSRAIQTCVQQHDGVTLGIYSGGSRHGSSYAAALSEGMERERTHHESFE